MNGKQAKKLRKAALGLATIFDESGRKIQQNGYVVRQHSNSLASASSVTTTDHQDDPAAPSLQYLNRPDSLRSIYRTMKKGVVKAKV